jgi:hypothetical protein
MERERERETERERDTEFMIVTFVMIYFLQLSCSIENRN